MKRAEFIVIAFVAGFLCGAAFTVAYMGSGAPEASMSRPVVLHT